MTSIALKAASRFVTKCFLIYLRRMHEGCHEDVKPTHDLDCLIDLYLIANDANLANTLKFRGR
jgi:hypothetical protein